MGTLRNRLRNNRTRGAFDHRDRRVHRQLNDRLTDITRIEYESEADRNNVSVKYYVTVRNQLAVVLTIAATDSPITIPHDAALSTVFINNVSQRGRHPTS